MLLLCELVIGRAGILHRCMDRVTHLMLQTGVAVRESSNAFWKLHVKLGCRTDRGRLKCKWV